MNDNLTMQSLMETWDKIQELKTIYYICNDYVPKEAIPKGKRDSEPSYFVVQMPVGKVVVLHPDYFDKLREEATKEGYKLVDYSEWCKWQRLLQRPIEPEHV